MNILKYLTNFKTQGVKQGNKIIKTQDRRKKKCAIQVMGCNTSPFICHTWCAASACGYGWKHVHCGNNGKRLPTCTDLTYTSCHLYVQMGVGIYRI